MTYIICQFFCGSRFGNSGFLQACCNLGWAYVPGLDLLEGLQLGNWDEDNDRLLTPGTVNLERGRKFSQECE